MSLRVCVLALSSAVLFLLSPGTLPAETPAAPPLPGKPVALVGDSYGRHDVVNLVRTIFDKADWVYEESGAFLPAKDFSKYSLVVISNSQEKPFTAEEQAEAGAYLRGGGRILLIQAAPNSMADNASRKALQDWLGMKVVRLKPDAEVPIKKDPLLDGVIPPQGEPPSWISGGEMGAAQTGPDFEALIGTEDGALAARRQVGGGKVYYLGSQPFRLRSPSSPHYSEDADSYTALIRNIIAEAKPLTITGWKAAQAGVWNQQGKRFLLWNREWQRGTETGPVFFPPLPEANEIVQSLPLDLAVDEYFTVQLNLTDLGVGGKVTWNFTGLPNDALAVFVQDKPNPIPWPKNPAIAKESPYWLMPPKSLNPEHEDAVRVEAGETRIFWLKFNTRGLRPGNHPVSFELLVDGQSAAKVELPVTVHPVRLPARRAITLQPCGAGLGTSDNAPPVLRFDRNLHDLGFEWSLLNITGKTVFRVSGGGPLDAKFVKGNFAAIASDAPPAIDFSAMDAFLDDALRHNLTYFRMQFNPLALGESLGKNAGLDEQGRRVVSDWYASQMGAYLRDKGLRNIYCGMGDELNEKELRERFLPMSEELAKAGFKTTSSFSTGSVSDPELTRRLSQSVGAWMLNRLFIRTFMERVKKGEIRLPAGALVGTYGAGEGRGTEIRKNESESRMIGWEAWGLGYDFCAPNPYFKSWIYYNDYKADRGIAGERFVSYLDINNLDAPLVNSPFLEGMSKSMAEGNLAKILGWYLEKLGDKVPPEIKRRAEAVIGSGEDAILRWRSKEYAKMNAAMISATRDQYDRARKEVLDLLDQVLPLVRAEGIKPSLFWNDLPLIEDGVKAELCASGDDLQTLQKAFQDAAGTALPVLKELPAQPGAFDQPLLIFVASEDTPGLPDWTKTMRSSYGGNSSWIREWKDPKSGKRLLWIGGKNREETLKALGRFPAFLRSEGAWLLSSL